MLVSSVGITWFTYDCWDGAGICFTSGVAAADPAVASPRSPPRPTAAAAPVARAVGGVTVAALTGTALLAVTLFITVGLVCARRSIDPLLPRFRPDGLGIVDQVGKFRNDFRTSHLLRKLGAREPCRVVL